MPETTAISSPPALSEKALQQHIVSCLGHLGYQALATGTPRRATRCPKCRHEFTPSGGNQNAAGVPDLLVYRDRFPVAALTGLEVKTATGRLTDEQKKLACTGRIVVVRSIRESVETLLQAERDFASVVTDSGYQVPRLQRFLRGNEGGIG